MTSDEQVGYLCHAFGRIHRSMMNRPRRSLELRPSEAGALWTIGRAGERGICPSEVSDRMSMARPSLTPILRELEKKGLIRRVADPNDGRRSLLATTGLFEQERRAMGEEHTRQMGRMLTGLTAREVDTLCELIQKIEEALPDPGEERFHKEAGQ